MKANAPILSWILIAAGTIWAAQTPQATPSKSNPSPTGQEIRSQLRQSQLAPLTPPADVGGSQKSLKELTEELRRLQLPQLQTTDTVSQKPKSPSESVAAKSSADEPSTQTSTSMVQDSNKVQKQPTKPAQPDKSEFIIPDTADPVMAVLTANPQAVVDLFSAAEALFAKRDLSRAAKLYQQVMDQMTDNLQDQNRSWVLFQYGNCLRISKSTEAAKVYEKVIADYPESDWAKVARARNTYFAWSQQAKPEGLLTRYGYDPNSF